MTKGQVIRHFQGRAEEYAEKARLAAFQPVSLKGPYEGMDKVLEAFWWLCDYIGRPAFIVELGCGAGTWSKFWQQGLGMEYMGYDSSPEAIVAAGEIWKNDQRFRVGDITERMASRNFIFIHGALMHLPPKEAWKVAAWTMDRQNTVMICEKVRWAKGEQPAPHVWIHDYLALFGCQPSYREPMNSTKDIFIFRPNTQAGGS